MCIAVENHNQHSAPSPSGRMGGSDVCSVDKHDARQRLSLVAFRKSAVLPVYASVTRILISTIQGRPYVLHAHSTSL